MQYICGEVGFIEFTEFVPFRRILDYSFVGPAAQTQHSEVGTKIQSANLNSLFFKITLQLN